MASSKKRHHIIPESRVFSRPELRYGYRTKMILPLAVFSHLWVSTAAFAGPTGGEVVGGSGTINQSGATTTINQATQSMAINWQTFNIDQGETVNFVQPNATAVALNRVLGGQVSTIQGVLNANGHVILVNPQGVYFTASSVVNVNGLIASSLDISPNDFMNGNLLFKNTDDVDQHQTRSHP